MGFHVSSGCIDPGRDGSIQLKKFRKPLPCLHLVLLLIQVIQRRVRAHGLKIQQGIADDLRDGALVFCSGVEQVEPSAIHSDAVQDGFDIVNPFAGPKTAFGVAAAFPRTDQDQDGIGPGLKGL